MRFITRRTHGEPDTTSHFAPLLLYKPIQKSVSLSLELPLQNESRFYTQFYKNDKWLHDAQTVVWHFFRNHPKGFFIEAGAVQGTVYDSNTLYFERFLGWNGLLVEANPYSFAKLLTRRPSSYRIDTALCSTNKILQFHLPDHQRNVDGCCGRANSKGNYKARCTPIGPLLRSMNITHVDFWSLDIEGSEIDALRGMDWNITVSV